MYFCRWKKWTLFEEQRKTGDAAQKRVSFNTSFLSRKMKQFIKCFSKKATDWRLLSSSRSSIWRKRHRWRRAFPAPQRSSRIPSPRKQGGRQGLQTAANINQEGIFPKTAWNWKNLDPEGRMRVHNFTMQIQHWPKPRPRLIPVLMELNLMIMFGSCYSGPRLRPRLRPRPKIMGTVPSLGTNIGTDGMELTHCHCDFVSCSVLVSIPV